MIRQLVESEPELAAEIFREQIKILREAREPKPPKPSGLIMVNDTAETKPQIKNQNKKSE